MLTQGNLKGRIAIISYLSKWNTYDWEEIKVATESHLCFFCREGLIVHTLPVRLPKMSSSCGFSFYF